MDRTDWAIVLAFALIAGLILAWTSGAFSQEALPWHNANEVTEALHWKTSISCRTELDGFILTGEKGGITWNLEGLFKTPWFVISHTKPNPHIWLGKLNKDGSLSAVRDFPAPDTYETCPWLTHKEAVNI